ncbi:MAG: substrate-binding domain-containing protein [Treponema sp.]|nr:substrate-binding domain-containing protein [Candidatus Treponema equifaecale]
MKINLKKIIAAVALVGTAVSVFAAPKFNSKKSISVLSREDGSGTRGAFIELFCIEKKDAGGKKVDYTTDEAAITNSTAVMLTSVAGDNYAIGYVSLGSLNDSVKAVKIDGADATVANINNGSYKISRPFNIAVKEGLSPVAQDFVNYIVSDEGQRIVAANKYIKVSTLRPSSGTSGWAATLGGAYTSNKASGKVVVAGSSSVSPVMEKLIESYKTVNPNAKIELQTSDSTTGVTNAINGTCDIGMASRALKDSEKAKGVQEVTIAIDGIAVIVNKANPVENMTKRQVEEIFTGKTTKWSEMK